MNKIVKTALLEALRSGKYEQGRYRLKSSSERFCCLGVLCELAVEAGVIPPVRITTGGQYEYDSEVNELPWKVQKWSGIQTPDAKLLQEEGSDSLIGFNDAGYTFEQIADIIESKF